jgi:CubicO group peptidase (beta-lactamase class C family)
MRTLFVTLAIVLCLPVSAQSSFARPAPSPTTVGAVAPPEANPAAEAAELEAFIDGVVAAHMREYQTPGVSVSVVRNGHVLFAKGYGYADVDKRIPVNADTIFRIGSVSKTYIWTLLMILKERGLIDLDADVNTYLKNFKIPEAFGAPVTINDLMAHRSGFEDSLSGFNRDKHSEQATLSGYLSHTIPARVYPPGTRTSYANWGATLAAQIVEDVSGVPYEEFLERELLKPLSLTHSTLKGPDIMTPFHREHLSVGYRIAAGRPMVTPYMSPGSSTPAGSMAASANDMARWMLMHLGRGTLDGVTVMQGATHDLMWKRAFTDRLAGADVAHGFYNKSINGVEVFGHGGATAAFYTDMVMAPSLGLGIFVSQNAANSPKLILDFAALVIGHVVGAAAPPVGDPQYKGNVAEFAGTYVSNRRVFSRFEKLFSGTYPTTVTPVAGNALTVAQGDIAQHFTPVPGAPDTFENRDGERIVFGRNASGAITHFSDAGGFHSFERARFADREIWLFVAIGVAAFFALTTLVGAWRWRRRGGQGGNAVVRYATLGAAVLVLAFTAAFLLMTAQALAGFWAFFANYPPASIIAMRTLGLILCVVAVAGLAGLLPAWRTASWGTFRKLHYSAFALSLALLAVMLGVWRVVFAPLG